MIRVQFLKLEIFMIRELKHSRILRADKLNITTSLFSSLFCCCYCSVIKNNESFRYKNWVYICKVKQTDILVLHIGLNLLKLLYDVITYKQMYAYFMTIYAENDISQFSNTMPWSLIFLSSWYSHHHGHHIMLCSFTKSTS